MAREIGRDVIGNVWAFLKASNATELVIEQVPLDVETSASVAEDLKSNQTLKELKLSHNQLNAASAKCLGHGIAENQCLEKLRINYNARMGAEGVEHLMHGIASNSRLRQVHFGDNDLQLEGWLMTCKGLECHPSLVHLDLSWALSDYTTTSQPHFLETMGKALGQLLQKTLTLEALLLTEDHLGAAAVLPLAEAVASHPSLRQLELNYADLQDEGALAIANMIRKNKKLEILGLHANDIGASGIEAICAAVRANKTLRKLDLRHNRCGDIGSPLGDALQYSSVESWDLRSMLLGLASFQAIAMSIGAHVKELNLGGNGSLDHAIAFASKLHSNLEILRLYLLEGSSDRFEIDLAQCLQNNLCLREMPFGSGGRSCAEVVRLQLKAMAMGCALESLGPCEVLDDEIQLLVKVLSNSKLHSLHCPFETPQALTHLLNAVVDPSCTLKVLNLSTSKLVGHGPLLAELLLKSSVEELILSQCHLGEEDALHIAKSLALDVSKGSLVDLDLSKNDLGLVALKALAEALGTNRTLRKLDLYKTGLCNESFNAIVGALQSNRTLRELIFSGDVDDLTILASTLAVNTTLQSIESKGDLINGQQVKLLVPVLETNCSLSSLTFYHNTPRKLKKDEDYHQALEMIDWFLTRNGHTPVILNSFFQLCSSGVQICLQTLGGDTVLNLVKDADETLGNLIREVFEELGYLRPLCLLLPDGRPWQQAAECQLFNLAAVSGGYPT